MELLIALLPEQTLIVRSNHHRPAFTTVKCPRCSIMGTHSSWWRRHWGDAMESGAPSASVWILTARLLFYAYWVTFGASCSAAVECNCSRQDQEQHSQSAAKNTPWIWNRWNEDCKQFYWPLLYACFRKFPNCWVRRKKSLNSCVYCRRISELSSSSRSFPLLHKPVVSRQWVVRKKF